MKMWSNYWDIYVDNLPSLVPEHEGKYVVINKKGLLGVFNDYPEATKESIKEYGLRPSYIKEICEEDLKHEKFGKPVSIHPLLF